MSTKRLAAVASCGTTRTPLIHAFNPYYYAQQDKECAVIDERYNRRHSRRLIVTD